MKRPGLRARVTAGFALSSLIVSALMALVSYQVAEGYLLAERERSGLRAANYDAGIVRVHLADNRGADYVNALRALDTGPARRALILSGQQWYSRAADSALAEAIPASLQQLTGQGLPAVQRVSTDTGPVLMIGIPLDGDTSFFVVDSLRELDRSLRVFSLVLLLVAALTTGLGTALGWYTARNVVRPLRLVTAAARDIATGDLTARLDPATEPDLAKLTTSFNDMVDQLSQRMQRDRRFAADVSHELRSPLQTLAAATSVLTNRKDSMEPRTAQAVDLLAGEVARFQTLVTDLLELARADQPADIATIDMVELAKQVCHSRGLSEGIVTTDGADPAWQADRRRFTQILGNLIDNANRHGGGVVEIHIGRTDGSCFLLVDDDGPGVHPADRTAIFSRFVRGRAAHARGETDGTGLGLALVAQHLLAHHGTIAVTDRPGGGARFRIEIPEQP